MAEFWRRKLPLALLIDVQGDGRWVRGLTEKIERLASDDETKDEANQLREYEGKARLALKVRPATIGSVPYEEARSIAAMLAAEGVELPLALRVALVSKRVDVCWRNKDLTGMMQALDFWATKVDFDPLSPCLAAVGGGRGLQGAALPQGPLPEDPCPEVDGGRCGAGIGHGHLVRRFVCHRGC